MPVIPQERNGGVCIATAGNFPKEVIHIALIFGIIGVVGAVASVLSLVIMLYDRQCEKKRSEPSAATDGSRDFEG